MAIRQVRTVLRWLQRDGFHGRNAEAADPPAHRAAAVTELILCAFQYRV
jgi:hypothetical protein